MDEERLLRIEESLDIYDRTHRDPIHADHVVPISRTARALLDEVCRLRAFVRKLYEAAKRNDLDVLDDTAAIEEEAAEVLGIELWMREAGER
jgi:hypothetical protein